MDERHNELGAVLADLRRRWTRRTRLGAWAAGASAAAMVLAVGLLAVWLVAAQGIPLAIVALAITALALVTLACAAWPINHPPSDQQLARYILAHRVWLGPHAASHGVTIEMVIDDIVARVPVP